METLAPQHETDDRPARLDTLQARADNAAHRLTADNTDREARAQYTARVEDEAHARAELVPQPAAFALFRGAGSRQSPHGELISGEARSLVPSGRSPLSSMLRGNNRWSRVGQT